MKNIKKILIVLVLIGQLCAQGVYFPIINQAPAYLILLIILGAMSIFDFFVVDQGIMRIDKKNNFAVVAVFLITDIVVAFLINGIFSIDRISLIIFSFLFCMACYQSIKSKEDIVFFEKVYIAVIFCSAIVAIAQAMGIEFANELWAMTHADDKISNAIASERYLGLASDILQLGYHLSAAIALTLFIKFKKRNFLKKLVLLCVFVTALIINNTRSAQIAALLMLLIWLFSQNKTQYKRTVLSMKVIVSLVLIIASVLVVFNVDTFLSETRFGDSHDGASARIPMFLTAFNHAFSYPLGMGVYSVIPEMIVGASSSDYAYVLENTAHNSIANCVASYGFIGLILMLMLYASIFRVYKSTHKKLDFGVVISGAVCAVCGLLLNSMFHNAYILTGELSSFLFFGIILSSTKFIDRKKTVK